MNEPASVIPLPLAPPRHQRFRPKIGTAGLLAVLTVVLAAPVASVVWSLRSPDREVWSLLARTTLLRMTATTLGLGVGVAGASTLLGVGLAWLCVMPRFPGRNLFRK